MFNILNFFLSILYQQSRIKRQFQQILAATNYFILATINNFIPIYQILLLKNLYNICYQFASASALEDKVAIPALVSGNHNFILATINNFIPLYQPYPTAIPLGNALYYGRQPCRLNTHKFCKDLQNFREDFFILTGKKAVSGLKECPKRLNSKNQCCQSGGRISAVKFLTSK